MTMLVNIDVPDLKQAVAFYTQAFGLEVRRRAGQGGAELTGWPVPVWLLEKAAGTVAAPGCPRAYERHWTPVHLDIVVEDMDNALSRAVNAGARVERKVQVEIWGKIVGLADPFGHGLCLIEFLNRGYDEIAAAGHTGSPLG